jgi:type I restriction enzyme S subunit
MSQESWRIKNLGELCEKPQYGFTASAAPEPVGPRFLRITDLSEGELDWKVVPYCRCSDDEKEKFKLKTGDLVVARIGATTGRTSLILNPPAAVFASYLIRLRPTNAVNPAFLFFYTQSNDYWSWIDGNKGNNLKGGVNATLLAETKVPLPPKPEQEKIAAVLWKIQRAIEIEEKVVATTRELKQSAMRQLFTRGLRNEPQKETPFGQVPKSWEIKPLAQWAFVQGGATKGRLISPEDVIEVPYLRVANVQDGHLDLSEMKTIQIRRDELDGYRLQKDDVVLTEGGDFDKLGRGFIWEGQIDPCIHQNHIFAVRVNLEMLWPRYFAYLAQSPYGKAYFLTVAHKTTNLACINTTKLRAFPVLRPELDEQKEIARILQTIDRKVLVHERKRLALQALFQTLLHQLMTAQIRVHRLDIDTSEVVTKT